MLKIIDNNEFKLVDTTYNNNNHSTHSASLMCRLCFALEQLPLQSNRLNPYQTTQTRWRNAFYNNHTPIFTHICYVKYTKRVTHLPDRYKATAIIVVATNLYHIHMYPLLSLGKYVDSNDNKNKWQIKTNFHNLFIIFNLFWVDKYYICF